MPSVKPIQDPAVAEKFAAYPPEARRALSALRHLILKTAAATEGVGALQETLKWGEHAFLTKETGSGSTIRIDWKKARPDEYAMFFNCKTSLVENFRSLFPNDFRFEGNRALVFKLGEKVPTDALEFCIAAALTYHRRQLGSKAGARSRTDN